MIFSELAPDGRNELWAILALRHARGLGPAGAGRIIAAYDGAYPAVEAGLSRPAEWAEKGLVRVPVARAFAGGAWRDKAGEEWNGIKSMNLSFIVQSDPAYPQLLREPAGAPLLLYCKGDVSLLRGPAVGVVGARNCTSEGLAVSAFFARDLARAGVTVISGMARGIDRAAHLAGLEGAGRSIGVLGTGIDVVYPTRNADLYARMEKEGLLVSEFAPGTGPNGKNFPIRNRLISGLALGILVVEAAGRSGSLITARLALEHNREVFAVPGSAMSPMSEGCRDLVRKGAKAVFDADDILLELAPLLHQKVLSGSPVFQERDNPPGSRPPGRSRSAAGIDCGLKHGNLRADATSPVDPSGPTCAEPGRALSGVALPGFADTASHPPAGTSPLRGKKRPASSLGMLPRGKKHAPSPAAQDAVSSLSEGENCRQTQPVFTERRSEISPPGDKADHKEQCAEGRVLSAVGTVPRHIDDIAHALAMDAGSLSAVLTMLEMRGLVRRLPGMLYSLNAGGEQCPPPGRPGQSPAASSPES
jgi:DNA processing protein